MLFQITIQKLQDLLNFPLEQLISFHQLEKKCSKTCLKLTSVYSHSALLCSAVRHTFVHSLSDFWNSSHIQNYTSFYRKKMRFTLYSLSRPKRSGEKKEVLYRNIHTLLQTILPFQNIRAFYRLPRLQVQFQPAVGSHVGTMHSFAAFLLKLSRAN